MAKRKKKEIDVPEDICLFTAKELDYIARAAKMIRWDVDVQTASINVPPDEVDEAEANLTVRHLCNEFAFVVQITIYCPVKEVFDPELKERKAPTIKEEETFCKVGDKFQNARTSLKMEVIDYKKGEVKKATKSGKSIAAEDQVKLQDIGTVRFPTWIGLNTVKEMIRRRAWVRI